MNTKIKRTVKSIKSASEILAFLQGDEETMDARKDSVVSISEDGDLLFYNSACSIDHGENVLINGLEPDSMGDGWETASASDVIDWLEKV